MKDLTAVVLACLLLLPASVGADKKKDPPAPVSLPSEHWNESRTVGLRTPAEWTVRREAGPPEVLETRGEGLIVRVLHREGEIGLDSLHAECMLVRLAAPMDTFPQVDYEYDFLGGEMDERRALDSAFVVHYDAPVEGYRDWRQRNLTVVGEGESICVIAYAPVPIWKKSKPARNLLTSVVESIRF
ncbi:MAG TPA: hypothetical protein VE359_06395 [Vicinamibacteria bacterium]|nr:hypothetical protein [Vicinamibacteria bacterium]